MADGDGVDIGSSRSQAHATDIAAGYRPTRLQSEGPVGQADRGWSGWRESRTRYRSRHLSLIWRRRCLAFHAKDWKL